MGESSPRCVKAVILEVASITSAIHGRESLGPVHLQREQGRGHSEEHDCQESGITGDHCGHRYPDAKLRRKLIVQPPPFRNHYSVSILGNSQTLLTA